jgi:hypothetical protein
MEPIHASMAAAIIIGCTLCGEKAIKSGHSNQGIALFAWAMFLDINWLFVSMGVL